MALDRPSLAPIGARVSRPAFGPASLSSVLQGGAGGGAGLSLAATLYAAGWVLITFRGATYAKRGHALWRCPDLATAATAHPPYTWGEA